MQLSKLQKILANEPPYRLKQAYQAVFENLIESWEEATNLPKNLRAELNKECSLHINARPYESRDGKTIKAVFILEDRTTVEAVLMRQRDGRNTLCVSSQVGCPLACEFCATGRLGYKRGLSSDEIVRQALFFARSLRANGERINNIVFMGMGEPLLNYGEVMKAVHIFNDKHMFNIGARKISISTVGIPKGISKLTNEPLQINLAVSLHAPNDKIRNELMPINKKYPIGEVLRATAKYIKKTGRRVMIEYLLLKNINDSPECARELADLLKHELKRLFFVNLIAYNPAGRYQPSEKQRLEQFKNILEKSGIAVTQRFRFGRDIRGACGQLAGKQKPRLGRG
jgi:23S rRNA (adenine2503-C2)-methyltransferase